jgi:hypothetical protein
MTRKFVANSSKCERPTIHSSLILQVALVVAVYLFASTLGLQFNCIFAAQEVKSVHYAESWKKGPHRIQPRKFVLRLDASNTSFQSLIQDPARGPLTLTIEPLYYVWLRPGTLRLDNKPPTPSSKVNFWNVKLLEPGQSISLLMVNLDQGDLIDQRNSLSRLDPVEDEKGFMLGIFGVPISTKRVIKVEEFYVVITVLNYELSGPKERAFEWIEVEIEFTNTKPERGN